MKIFLTEKRTRAAGTNRWQLVRLREKSKQEWNLGPRTLLPSPLPASLFRRPTFYVLVRIPYATEIIFFAHWSPPKAMNSSRKGHLSPSLCVPSIQDSSWFSASVQKCCWTWEWLLLNYLHFSLNSLVLTNEALWGSSPGMEKALWRTVSSVPKNFLNGQATSCCLFHLIPALSFNTCGHQSPPLHLQGPTAPTGEPVRTKSLVVQTKLLLESGSNSPSC